jgi:hypothetical protein
MEKVFKGYDGDARLCGVVNEATDKYHERRYRTFKRKRLLRSGNS